MANINVMNYVRHTPKCPKGQGFAEAGCTCGLDEQIREDKSGFHGKGYISSWTAGYARHLATCACLHDDMTLCDCGLSETKEYQSGFVPHAGH